MIRIVKMTFKETTIDEFKDLFSMVQAKIECVEGCNYVRLLQDLNNPCNIMTYSLWDSPSALENYRNSNLFLETWKKTKPLFAQKAEAWSVDEIA